MTRQPKDEELIRAGGHGEEQPGDARRRKAWLEAELPLLRLLLPLAVAGALLTLGGVAPASPRQPPETSGAASTAAQAPAGFAGGLREVDEDGALAVRHDVHQPGSEVVTLRWFKIKDGSFDEFLRASIDGVWPYYEKLGARVIGMWRVTGREGPPANSDGDDGQPAFDEVYLATRYASVAHWEATREPQRLGGNGPDWEACEKALEVRRGLTLETRLVFLEGAMASNGPYFQPALPERYRLMEGEAGDQAPGGEQP